MHAFCSQKGLDHKHVVALIHGTSQVWMAAERSHGGRKTVAAANSGLYALLTKSLIKLKELMPNVDSRSASSLLHSFAKLRLNPDTLVPDSVDSLAHQLMEDLECTSGHSYASTLCACVDLRLNPCRGEMLLEMVRSLSSADMSSFVPQDVTNITYGLAKLPAHKPSPQLLDALCSRLLEQLLSDKMRPNPQDISIFAWSLQQLKHVPSAALAEAMLSRMLECCYDDKHIAHRLLPQQISNFLLAYAVLRLA